MISRKAAKTESQKQEDYSIESHHEYVVAWYHLVPTEDRGNAVFDAPCLFLVRFLFA